MKESKSLNKIDILEDYIYDLSPELLDSLLKDHSTKKNIIWATDNYSPFGKSYEYNKEIKVNSITKIFNNVIKPRVNKTKSEQEYRIREKAEVFTPAWVCNIQNNQIDENWFGRKNVFNKETKNGWKTHYSKIDFKTKTWIEYIDDIRLEISCGEAPYLTSRYDAVTGEIIEPKDRIGLLDRKLRIINENCKTIKQWSEATERALKSIYGFEWQGDSLLLARENILFSVIDYYKKKFNKLPSSNLLIKYANIISWNIWQMDGMKYVVPQTCKKTKYVQTTLFGDDDIFDDCPGCRTNNYQIHNGKYCFIMDWSKNKKVKYADLLRY